MAAYTALSGAALSLAGTTGCALHGASLFLVWPRKSNQKEGHPDIRPFAARRVPSLHRRSRGTLRRAIPGPSQLSRHPCRSTPSTAITLGLLTGIRDRVVWKFWRGGRKALCLFLCERTNRKRETSSLLAGRMKLVGRMGSAWFGKSSAVVSGGKCCAVFHPALRKRDRVRVVRMFAKSETKALCLFTDEQTIRRRRPPLSEGRMESLRRGASGMDAARAVKGHGWPLRGDPRSSDGMREVSRSETRMQGQAFLITFSAPGKSDSPSRAKPMHWPARLLARNSQPSASKPLLGRAELRAGEAAAVWDQPNQPLRACAPFASKLAPTDPHGKAKLALLMT